MEKSSRGVAQLDNEMLLNCGGWRKPCGGVGWDYYCQGHKQ